MNFFKAGIMQERREHSRIIFNREVYINFDNDRSLECMAHDFSMRGIGLFTDEAIAINTLISVELQLLGQQQQREINLQGRVVYSRPDGAQYKTGISFA